VILGTDIRNPHDQLLGVVCKNQLTLFHAFLVLIRIARDENEEEK
jgi:hypothetical protein